MSVVNDGAGKTKLMAFFFAVVTGSQHAEISFFVVFDIFHDAKCLVDTREEQSSPSHFLSQ
jgi:predicted ATPase